MIALAIAWAIIGTATFLGMLLEYVEDRLKRYGSPFCSRDAWGVPAGWALLALLWPVALVNSARMSDAP